MSFSLLGRKTAPEIIDKCFSFLTLSELGRAGQVCSLWHNVSEYVRLWRPFFIGLKISVDIGDAEIKNAVLSDLRANEPLVAKILSMIDNDQQLASIMDLPSASLEKLKKMPSLECTYHVMRSLRKDCTKLFIYLPGKFVRAEATCVQQCENALELQYAVIRFYETEKYLPFLHELLKNPPGPYDAAETMTYTLNLLRFSMTQEKVACICAPIVKSHSDLSKVFQQDFDYGNPIIGPNPIPMTRVILRTIIPMMEELGLDVTIKDWSLCGFPH